MQEARSYLGTPWRHQGRTRRGIDCAGLVVLVSRALGLADYDSTGYQRRPQSGDFVGHFDKNLTRRPRGEALPGDVILFRDRQYTCHSAIVSERHGKPTIVHAYARRRRVVEEYLDQDDWENKIMHVYSFPALRDEPWLS